METLNALRQKKYVRVLVWQLFNAIIVCLIAWATDAGYEIAVLLPFVNMLTKYINKTYFGDLGVE